VCSAGSAGSAAPTFWSLTARIARREPARAEEGLSLTDYVLRELRRSVSYPNQAELVARIRARGELKVSLSPAEAIRQGREER
jgi:hypothetical protein